MKTLISVVGTTGIGKTKLAIALAQHFNTEIISCDSRQFFREMKIGTAAPSEDELSQAKHHFIGQLSVKDYYSIGQFEHDSLGLLDQLFEKYDIVIMVGGSMMYEKAVIEGLNDLPEANEENQKKLETIWKTEGIEKLQEMLKDLDPEYYENVIFIIPEGYSERLILSGKLERHILKIFRMLKIREILNDKNWH